MHKMEELFPIHRKMLFFQKANNFKPVVPGKNKEGQKTSRARGWGTLFTLCTKWGKVFPTRKNVSTRSRKVGTRD